MKKVEVKFKSSLPLASIRAEKTLKTSQRLPLVKYLITRKPSKLEHSREHPS